MARDSFRSQEVVVSKHYVTTTTSAQSHTLYLEVVVANLSESTTTSKQLATPKLVEEGTKAQFAFFFENYFSP
jgi:hypothetical protein